MGLVSKFLFLSFLFFFLAITGCTGKFQTLSSLTSITSQSNPTYTWQEGPWSACSATACGTLGSETRSIQCLSSDNSTVDVSFCPTPAPANSQSCQTAPCPPAAACTLPWGGTIPSGQFVNAFQSSSVPNGQTCTSQTRVCTNGVLSGSFTFQSCTVQPPPAACNLPWGGSIASGQSTTAFKTASVANGHTCQSQTRTCTNGVLSGSFTFQSCTVQPPPAACNLPWGGSIASGQNVTAFQSATVPNGQTCSSQVRTCTNGTLSGSFTAQSCTVLPPAITCLNPSNRLATDDLIYVDGQVTDNNEDVTQFTNIFGINRAAASAPAQAWPNIVNLLVNFTIPKFNYIAMQFTVPTTIADQSWGTVGSTSTLSNLNATMSISTTCGDFKNIHDNCHNVAPIEGAGIIWQVANTPSSGTCVLQKGQTYFLNISYYNLDGTTNSRCANATCATTIQNGPTRF